MISLNQVARSIVISSAIASSLLPQLAFAQSREVVCLGTTYARVKTRNFYVNICGNSSRPTQYVGTSNGGQAIVLPLSSNSRERYVAVNGNIRYVLTPSSLIVTKSGRTIVNERVVSWSK
jgi:hypothetical protein